MPIVNLTPHPIILFDNETPDQLSLEQMSSYTFETIAPSSDTPVRLREIFSGTSSIEGTLIQNIQYGHLTFEPPQVTNYYYIVSLPVALATIAWRNDFLVPFREVRNSDGTVIGCRSLARPV